MLFAAKIMKMSYKRSSSKQKEAMRKHFLQTTTTTNNAVLIWVMPVKLSLKKPTVMGMDVKSFTLKEMSEICKTSKLEKKTKLRTSYSFKQGTNILYPVNCELRRLIQSQGFS